MFETIPQKVVLVFGRFFFFFNAQTFSCKTFHPEAAPWGLPNLTVLLPEGVQRRRTSLCVQKRNEKKAVLEAFWAVGSVAAGWCLEMLISYKKCD